MLAISWQPSSACASRRYALCSGWPRSSHAGVLPNQLSGVVSTHRVLWLLLHRRNPIWRVSPTVLKPLPRKATGEEAVSQSFVLVSCEGSDSVRELRVKLKLRGSYLQK